MRWSLIKGAGLAGVGIASVAAAARRAEERALTSFYAAGERDAPVWEVREARVRPPAHLHRSDGFSALYSVDAEAVAAMLPSTELLPVRLTGGRAGLMIAAYRHHEIDIAAADGSTVTIRPYGEIVIGVPVTRRPAPPMLPLFLPARYGAGTFVLHAPVTTRLARDLDRAWGLPAFVADMEFDEEPAGCGVRLSEGGLHILTLRVRAAGRVAFDRAPIVLYGAREGALQAVSMPTLAYRQQRLGGAAADLELGEHPVARELRRLGVSGGVVMSRRTLVMRARRPAGRLLGETRPCTGHAGSEADTGLYAVRHAAGESIDQYAALSTAEYQVARARTPAPGRLDALIHARPIADDAEDLTALGLS